jgi:hypothetical protein
VFVGPLMAAFRAFVHSTIPFSYHESTSCIPAMSDLARVDSLFASRTSQCQPRVRILNPRYA